MAIDSIKLKLTYNEFTGEWWCYDVDNISNPMDPVQNVRTSVYYSGYGDSPKEALLDYLNKDVNLFIKYTPEDSVVQIQHPTTGRYVKLNKAKGCIIAFKKTQGPYKNTPIITNTEINILIDVEE